MISRMSLAGLLARRGDMARFLNAGLLRQDWPVLRGHLDPRLRRWCERRFRLGPEGRAGGDVPRDACQAGVMRKYVIMGVQGSGKGTQAMLLADDLDLVHISVGDIFRWNV